MRNEENINPSSFIPLKYTALFFNITPEDTDTRAPYWHKFQYSVPA